MGPVRLASYGPGANGIGERDNTGAGLGGSCMKCHCTVANDELERGGLSPPHWPTKM